MRLELTLNELLRLAHGEVALTLPFGPALANVQLGTLRARHVVAVLLAPYLVREAVPRFWAGELYEGLLRRLLFVCSFFLFCLSALKHTQVTYTQPTYTEKKRTTH